MTRIEQKGGSPLNHVVVQMAGGIFPTCHEKGNQMADKNISLKFVGLDREAEVLTIQPGTTCRDVLQSVGMGTGYALTDPSNPEQSFHAGDNIYALVEDGDMLGVASSMDAGNGRAAR